MEYISYIVFGAVCFYFGYIIRGMVVIMNLSRNPEATIKMLEQIKKINEAESQEQLDQTMASIKSAVPDATELVVEEVKGVFYAYTKETNKFIAQGASLSELLETAHSRFPGSKFFGTVEENNSAKQVAQ